LIISMEEHNKSNPFVFPGRNSAGASGGIPDFLGMQRNSSLMSKPNPLF